MDSVSHCFDETRAIGMELEVERSVVLVAICGWEPFLDKLLIKLIIITNDNIRAIIDALVAEDEVIIAFS